MSATYFIAQAIQATGVTRGTINGWIKRGLFRGHGEAPGQGKARAYSLTEVAAIALVQHLTGGGWMAGPAIALVNRICDSGLLHDAMSGREDTILAVRSAPEGGHLVTEYTEATTIRDADVATIINLSRIGRRIEARLRMPECAQRAETLDA